MPEATNLVDSQMPLEDLKFSSTGMYGSRTKRGLPRGLKKLIFMERVQTFELR
jgi:hypothetical protein